MIKTYLLILIIFSTFLLWSLLLKVSEKAESTASTLPHITDFLNLPICGTNTWCGTTWYPTHTASERAAYRQQLKNKGYTHLYLSITSRRHDFFDKANGAAEFRALLQEIVNDGLMPVVFLTSDTDGTTGNWSQQSIGAIKSDLTSFIPKIDSMVNSYVLGIEIDEYWKYSTNCEVLAKTAAQCVGEHLDSLTSKPLAAHQYPGRWDLCTGWCDYMLLQTNNPARPTTATEVKNTITNARNALNKPVVAGEYYLGDETVSISLGTSAQEACSAGFGNGGIPSNIVWPNCDGEENTSIPTKNVTLTPTITPTLKPSMTPTNSTVKMGDANGDSKVDVQDYTIWLSNDGTNTNGGATKGDFNQDNTVDRQDYLIWLSNYGK